MRSWGQKRPHSAVNACFFYSALVRLNPVLKCIVRTMIINPSDLHCDYCIYNISQCKNKIQFSLKALNGIQWEVAHPLTLNYEAPFAS